MPLFWASAHVAGDRSDSECKRNTECQACSICFMPISSSTKAVLQPCLHAFHFECIDRWLRIRRYCAYCRTVFPHVLHSFTSPVEYSTKFYDEPDASTELDIDDLEILDWHTDFQDVNTRMQAA